MRGVAAPLVAQVRRRIGDLVSTLQAEGRWDASADAQEVAKGAVSLLPGFILQRLILRDVDADRYAAAVAGLLAGQREPRPGA